MLRCKGLRVETDTRNEKIGYKIREQTLQRIPYLLVAGSKEQEEGTIAIRSRDGEDLGVMDLTQAMAWLLAAVEAPDALERRVTFREAQVRLEGKKYIQPA